MKTLTILLASAVCVLAQNFQAERVYLGDSQTLTIPMAWQGQDFEPGTDWALIWTAKAKAADPDAQALIQKSTGAGITLDAYEAKVALVRADTVSLPVGTLVWDVQASEVATGDVRTVARGTLTLERDVTRQTTTSIPVVTTEDPLPIGARAFADLTDKTTADLPGINGPLATALSGKALLGVEGEDTEQIFWKINHFNNTCFFKEGIVVTGAMEATDIYGNGSNIVGINAGNLSGFINRAVLTTALRSFPASKVSVTSLTGFELITPPAAPSNDGFEIYAEDNGAGKTRLMVRFATGAPQQLSIQP